MSEVKLNEMEKKFENSQKQGRDTYRNENVIETVIREVIREVKQEEKEVEERKLNVIVQSLLESDKSTLY